MNKDSFINDVSGTEEGQLINPCGIAIDKSGNICVGDRGNHRVQVFTPEGKNLLCFGTYGDQYGQLNSPTFVAITDSNWFLVNDYGNNRIVCYDHNGLFSQETGTKGSDPGEFAEPGGIAVDREGFVVVADTANNRVQVLTPNLKYFGQFGCYGNNDVEGPDAGHGTHVAGIVAAIRNNDIGMNGVANNAEIMVLRAVPDGDEYDKDIALAIRYAVDNGAKVINTSFGKYYSPNPEWVWDAIKYAAEKDVLIVNAAGNEGYDLDTIMVYPNDQQKSGEEISNTFITIGALAPDYGSEMVANFSNYGKTSVDVFAPGVKIWSTTPLNTYEYLQGTSMAAPAVAGVAATIRSYYPSLSAAQVKQILMDSGLTSNTPVVLGGDPSNTKGFKNASVSGKMVNLYNALILADKMSRS